MTDPLLRLLLLVSSSGEASPEGTKSMDSRFERRCACELRWLSAIESADSSRSCGEFLLANESCSISGE
jgi:hypothetical protein